MREDLTRLMNRVRHGGRPTCFRCGKVIRGQSATASGRKYHPRCAPTFRDHIEVK